MGQKFNPNTGQWEDDTTTSTGAQPQPAPFDPIPTPGPSPDVVSRSQLPAGPTIQQTADPSLLGPNYSGPAPASFGGPATTADQTPVPSVDPGVVYTDPSGRGYDPSQLYASRNELLKDPINARVRDILSQYGYGAAPAAGAAAPTASGAVAGAATMPGNPFNDQVRQILMAELAKAGQPVDPNSPEITATLSAARDEGSRASDAERTALAERLYAQNARGGGGSVGDTGALTTQIQQSGEKQAATLSTLKGQLLMNAYNRKAQQLQQDLQLAVQSGDAESVRQVQLTIENLRAALQREGFGINLAEFGASLDQNSALAGLRG